MRVGAIYGSNMRYCAFIEMARKKFYVDLIEVDTGKLLDFGTYETLSVAESAARDMIGKINA